MKTPSWKLAWGILLISTLVFSSQQMQAQEEEGTQYWMLKIKMSRIVFGEVVSGEKGTENEQLDFYIPGDLGVGGEFGYEFRKGNLGIEGNLGIRQMRYNADIVFDYDIYNYPRRSAGILAAEGQVLGKYYFNKISSFDLNIQLGMGTVYHNYGVFAMMARPIASPQSWGWQTLSGIGMNFPFTDKFAIHFAAKYGYQLNGYFERGNDYYERLKTKNLGKNNHTINFSIGLKTTVN